MKKILLVGEYFSSNLGDGVLCSVVESILKESLSDCTVEIFDLSLNKAFQQNDSVKFKLLKKQMSFLKKKATDRLLKCNQKNKEYLKEFEILFEKKIEDINIIVFPGGQMFNDTFINKIAIVVQKAEERELPVLFNACGFANYVSKDLLKQLKSILKSPVVKMISVRDGYAYVKKMNMTSCVMDTGDTALLTDKYFELYENKKNIVGLGIMFSKNQSPIVQIKLWDSILNKMITENIKFKMFCNGNPYDYGFAEYILRRNGLDVKKYLEVNPVTPDQLVNLIYQYHSMISMRLHSLIIASSLNIPAIAICWDKKVQEFYEKINMKDYCVKVEDYADIIVQKMRMLEKRGCCDKNALELTVEKNVKNLLNIIDNL